MWTFDFSVFFQWKISTPDLAIISQIFPDEIFLYPHVHRWLLAIGLVHTPVTRNPSQLPQFLLLAIVPTILSTVSTDDPM